jgi:5-methylcytosine-specific restriction protein A
VNLTRERYCEAHTEQITIERIEYNTYERSKKHVKFYNSAQWKAARKQALQRDKHLCVHCQAKGEIKLADVVDHITELSDDYEQRTELGNLQSLCHGCHSKKTAEEKQRRIENKNK